MQAMQWYVWHPMLQYTCGLLTLAVHVLVAVCVVQNQYKDSYMPIVEAKLPLKNREMISGVINNLVEMYAVVCTRGDVNRAQAELKRKLKDEVAFERSTVWRDMVAMERRGASVAVHVSSVTTVFRVLLMGLWLRVYMQ